MRDDILKDVYDNQLVELSSIEVNLAFEFKKFTEVQDKIDSIYNPFLDSLNKAYVLEKIANDLGKKASSDLYKLAQDLSYQKQIFEKRVTDLGIDVSKLTQPKEYDKLINIANDYADYSKKAIEKYK